MSFLFRNEVRKYQSSDNRSTGFKNGLESSVRKYYALGIPKDTLQIAMGISEDELLQIITKNNLRDKETHNY